MMSQSLLTECTSLVVEDGSSISEEEAGRLEVLRDGKQFLLFYKLFYDQLKKLKIVSPVADLSDIRTVLRQCSADFIKLVNDALNMFTQSEPVSVTLNADIQQRLNDLLLSWTLPMRNMTPNLSDNVALYTSRYLNDFDEMKLLGKGGYGLVYRAKHKLDDCQYAVKKIYINESIQELSKILQEVWMLAHLNHKNIVRYHTVWLEDNNPVTAPEEPRSQMMGTKIGSGSSDGGIVFESVGESVINMGWTDTDILHHPEDESSTECCSTSEGHSSSYMSQSSIMKSATVILNIQMELCSQTLAKWLEDRNKPELSNGQDVYSLVKEDESRKIMRDLLEAVKYIHSRNIIHRDLKPENIFLLMGDGNSIHAKIGDFGLARKDTENIPSAGRQETVAGCGNYTKDVGTVSYAAPEQLNSHNYGTKADMFSIGHILLEMYQPFKTTNEKCKSLQQIRLQELPAKFTHTWPQQANCILSLVGEADRRPTAEEVISQKFLYSHEERQDVIKDTQLSTLYMKVKQLEEQNQRQKQTITCHEQTNLQKDKTISQHEQTISQHEQTISQHEQMILQHEQTNLQKDKTISQHEQTISQHEQTISQLNMKISQQEQ